MKTSFWNREEGLSKLRGLAGKSGFGYVTGRRRVGKTAILVKACEEFSGIYHQAVEGTPQQQLLHLSEELRGDLPLLQEITPKSWAEFFAVLSRETLPKILVFDEFPYWVKSDPSLPSLLQKWIDHELPKKKTFIWVSGSSQSMLYSQFLNHSSPLYGRSKAHLHLEPMPFQWFCRVFNYSSDEPLSFERYSIVGGVPHYWKLMPKASLLEQVHTLYFEPNAILSEEPSKLLNDEGVTGALPKAIIDLVGRGVARPSELASRLGTVQGNLSRPLALLLDLGLIHRELPFGESTRTTKKVLYSIRDPALAFYYGTYLPFRTRWASMSPLEKQKIVGQHASKQWEIFCQRAYPGSSRYWEEDLEFDLVAPLKGSKRHLIGECKWRQISTHEEARLLQDLKNRFVTSKLSKKISNVEFRIFSKKSLSDPHEAF